MSDTKDIEAMLNDYARALFEVVGYSELSARAAILAAFAERDARIAELEAALSNIEAVTCDPEGNVCIRGSDGDRAVIQRALAARKGEQ